MPKTSPRQRKTLGRVMHEFAHGELKSGPEGKGGKVTSRRQAIAIALKEAGASKYESKPENKRNLAKSERKTLASNPVFDRLRDKVPSFFGQQPTPLTFTNKDRLHRKDRAVVDLVVGANQQCRTLHAPLYARLPPQVIAAIHDLERKEDALIRELYVGRITFGEFNMKIDGLNKEYSALVLAQISGQKTEEGK